MKHEEKERNNSKGDETVQENLSCTSRPNSVLNLPSISPFFYFPATEQGWVHFCKWFSSSFIFLYFTNFILFSMMFYVIN